ncbi:glycosyltransferase [Planktothrix sp. FACHB-1355]|uniref:Glycosyltransferase n=1 Tax=Aerosakkonema funiforme FACHB-1375 TaxID=2949571 RepID=A0A926ZG99_9CYAN|nr:MULTISPECIES: glycosyltransferase [Oscillatoriales]MBD2181715.1 glycosyltransferase [Aerosakkonema funiforme FACHB-1375]MBD3559644.1 glycosyltransferase [Planktothrix sp. FACHB-1355]
METTLPKVSVIVPIYNGEADLPDLISCLQAQTYPTDRVEYLLVDNGSSDRTPSILQAAAASDSPGGGNEKLNKINIRHLTENKIQSSYAARNTGIRAATGEIIAFTDVDCRPEPNWLQNLIQPFADSSVGIVAGEVEGLPGKTLLEKYADSYNVLSQKYTLEHPFCPYGQTANLAIRREIFQQVGLFRPYMTTGGDADICWRIQRETSWQISFAPTAIVKHRHRSTVAEFQKQWRRYGRSNRYLHELYGVTLMTELKATETFYRLVRWLLKELPVTSVKAMIGKATVVDLLNTPISLLNSQARSTGQRDAKLSEEAKIIERL